MQLATLTCASLADPAADGRLLIVPLGATEQHGPHLPLTTDTDIAVALALATAEGRPDAVVAPPLAYGSSGEHAGFAGTVSIGGDATELVVTELCRSASASFGRILLLCAHGGNAGPVRSAVTRLRAEGRDVRAWFPSWDGDAHAGHVETSVMLALAPARVDLSRAEAGDPRPLRVLLPRLRREGMRAVSPNGVLGDPRGASADAGRQLLDGAVSELHDLLAAWPQAAPSPS